MKGFLCGHSDPRGGIVCLLAHVAHYDCVRGLLLYLCSPRLAEGQSVTNIYRDEIKSALIKHFSALPNHFTSTPTTLGNRKE